MGEPASIPHLPLLVRDRARGARSERLAMSGEWSASTSAGRASCGNAGRAARFVFFALVAGASVPFGRRGQALARDSRRGG